MTWPVRIVLLGIRAYQLLLSPFAGGGCRFEPSCSVYALQAVETHGARRGAVLAVRRVLRCHPLTPPGFDPVPPKADRPLTRSQA